MLYYIMYSLLYKVASKVAKVISFYFYDRACALYPYKSLLLVIFKYYVQYVETADNAQDGEINNVLN
jgi:hypothetical protein